MKLKKKKWKNPQQVEWKKPSLIIITSLITIILIIPTVIVVPFIETGGETKQPTEKEQENSPVVINESDSPFSVKVFRTNDETSEMVPLEEYVTRVVASEMPADFELEALKAQALAARTFIVNHLMYFDKEELPDKVKEVGADVPDTVQFQVYKSDDELRTQWGADYNAKINKIKKAVAATKGEIITYNDQPINPSFFSTSNGYTEDSEKYWENKLPYLRSVESPWDKESPKFLDQKILTVAEVENALGIQIAANQTFEMERTDSNRVATLTLGGSTFTGREIRESLELRSSDFSIEQKNDHFIFTTKGYGHGIGMSQYGANGMAKEGKTYKEIVTYYYQDAKVAALTDTAPKLVVKK